jgi:hypothetical protein
MKLISILFLLPLFSLAQNSIDMSRHASVWVMPKTGMNFSLLSESYPLMTDTRFPVAEKNKPTLYIPADTVVTASNGNRYIQAYLINAMSDAFKIDRCDATLYPAETQILVNKEWKTYQRSMGSTCGNSYFTSTLLPGSFYSLRIDVNTATNGNLATQFRLKIRIENNDYVSNPYTMYLTKKEIEKAGKRIEPL